MLIQDLIEISKNPKDRLYVTPGTRVHAIGSQDGSFPAFGHHVENEMGGIWMHPIKLLDGYWLGLKVEDGEFQWLKHAKEFRNHAFYNEFLYELNGLEITRIQFTAENKPGLVVQYKIKNLTKESQFFEGNFIARSDIQPVWLSDEKGILTEKDLAWTDGNRVIFKDNSRDWFALISTDFPNSEIKIGDDICAYEKTFGEGFGAAWDFRTEISPEETVTFNIRITGSVNSLSEAEEEMDSLSDINQLFVGKEKRYQEILDTADIDIPDKELMKQYSWVKCHTEWLTIDAPNVGCGLSAGIPEYPWWFGCDSAYAFSGCLPAGFHNLAEDTTDIIAKASNIENGNGRIIHEINTFGMVSNPGNTQETALFIRSVYEIYLWTGNLQWLSTHYETIKNGIKWLFNDMDTDGDLFPEGYGIMEVAGLNGELIDTVTYSASALKDAAKIANIFGDNELSSKYLNLSQEVIQKINNEMWIDSESLYADIRISEKELYPRLDMGVKQYEELECPNAVSYYQNLKEKMEKNNQTKGETDSMWCFQNWVVATPLEVGITEKTNALRSLERLNSEEFVGEYGMYLSGLEHSRMMTISTAVLIKANLQYGLTNEAYQLLKKMMKTFNMYLPGSISEGSPDYGCMVQAWTSYGYINPIICGFIGVSPNAAEKIVYINPQLPDEWDHASVTNLKVGTNEITIKVARSSESESGYIVQVNSVEPEWEFPGATTIEYC